MSLSKKRGRVTSSRLAVLCLSVLIAVGSIGVVYGAWIDEVIISGSISTGNWEDPDEGGRPGFWGSWNSHKTYTEAQVLEFLVDADTGSMWLGPTTTDGMADVFRAGSGRGSTSESRFLRQYLATLLNVASGRLNLSSYHDVTLHDAENFLELQSPSSATAAEIIAGMEDRADDPAAITSKQYEAMKNISEALNKA